MQFERYAELLAWCRFRLGADVDSALFPQVLEETGFDLTGFFPRDQLAYGNVEEENAERRPYYVELVIKEQKIRLYFIAGIHEDTYFETRTRKEISVSLHLLHKKRTPFDLALLWAFRKLIGLT